MALIRGPTVLTTVRFESTNSSSNGAPPPHNQNPPGRRLLSVTKPSWIVRTESNVWREKIKKPDPPCVVCRGSGRVDCTHCRGKGRTNEVHLAMLSKGSGLNGAGPVVEVALATAPVVLEPESTGI